MNPKESLSQRIAFHKQQIANDQQADLQRRKDQELISEENKKQAIVDERKKLAEIEAKTKENFKDTSIIEIFEEIIDKQLLVLDSTPKTRYEKKLFGEKRIDFNQITPARITYHLNVISLEYGNWEERGNGEYQEGWCKGHTSIDIKKIDGQHFGLTHRIVQTEGDHEGKPAPKQPDLIGDINAITDSIAEIIAERQQK